MSIYKALVISDLHVPFEDRKALRAVEKYMADERWDEWICLGDFLDFNCISHFNKNLVRKIEGQTLQADYDAGNEVLDRHQKIVRKRNRKAKFTLLEGNHECLDVDTEILTDGGWRRFDQVEAGQRTLVLEPEDMTCSWRRINAVVRKPFAGELYNIHSARVDMLVTPEHRLLLAEHNKGYKFIKAKDLENKSTRISVPVAANNRNSDYPISDDELRILAWFLTDGNWVGPLKYVNFSQSVEKAKLITDILDSLGWSYAISKRKRRLPVIKGRRVKTAKPQYVIRLHVPHHQWFRDVLGGRKRIPDWVFFLSPRQFSVFLNSLVDGDGNRLKTNGTALAFYSSSREEVDVLQALAASNGWRASIHEYRKGQYRVNLVNRLETQLATSGKLVEQNVDLVPYRGTVWCVSVPGENFLVRRNGKTFFTGNSRVEKYIDELPQLRDTIEVARGLNLDKRKIEWIRCWSEGDAYRVGGAFFHHGLYVNQHHAKKMAESFGGSVFYGHTHTVQSYSKVLWGAGKTVIGASLGCLCKYDQDYIGNNPTSWQHAFGVFYFLPDGSFNYYVVRVNDGTFVAPNGKFYDGRV